MNPIYVKADNTKLEDTTEKIKALLKELDEVTRWLPLEAPQLYAVPAPDGDCLSCGGLVVYGVSALDEAKKDALRLFLCNLCCE